MDKIHRSNKIVTLFNRCMKSRTIRSLYLQHDMEWHGVISYHQKYSLRPLSIKRKQQQQQRCMLVIL